MLWIPRAGYAEPNPPPMNSSLLQIRDLEVRYRSDRGLVHAVNGVNLMLDHGEIVGLIGESGSGKTTLGHAILGVVTARPGVIGGEIWFEGQDLLRLSGAQLQGIRGRRITMISQDPLSSLNPVFSVGEQLADSIRYRRQGQLLSLSGSLTEEAASRLASVGLSDPARQLRSYPHELSGGMRQRVLIAIAALGGQALLIADEPTTSLDVTIQAQILALLRQLVDEHGLSILYISHDLAVVAQLCDRVAVMYAGQIVEEARVHRIYSEPRHPYTRALIQVTRLQAGEPLVEIPGEVPDMVALPGGCLFSPRCAEAAAECRERRPLAQAVEPGHIHRCGRLHGQWARL